MRPEYVKCVSLPDGLGGDTWCGRRKNRTEWRFVDVDHAALSRRNGDRLLVCPECRTAIISALESDE